MFNNPFIMACGVRMYTHKWVSFDVEAHCSAYLASSYDVMPPVVGSTAIAPLTDCVRRTDALPSVSITVVPHMTALTCCERGRKAVKENLKQRKVSEHSSWKQISCLKCECVCYQRNLNFKGQFNNDWYEEKSFGVVFRGKNLSFVVVTAAEDTHRDS